ncbi:MAG: MlaD family protein [Chthoniobacteraceae bacterium]
MQILRNEIRTGLLVVLTLVALVAALLYLGAPGVFSAQKKFHIYFINAAGIKPGAQVMLAGRKIGQVRALYSPVPEKERPRPELEALVEVQVEASAKIYQKVNARMVQPSLLGESVIDFTLGEEASGLAPDGASFVGERPPGIADAVPAVLEKIDPVMIRATATLDALEKTAANLTKITAEGSDLPAAFAEFKKFGTNLNELTGPGGSLRRSVDNVESLTGEKGKLAQSLDGISALFGPESSLSKTLANSERFTATLANNEDIKVTLRNFRNASVNLNGTLDQLGNKFTEVGANLEQASDTVKRQPWRLIWPSTKKYENAREPEVRRAIPVKKRHGR